MKHARQQDKGVLTLLEEASQLLRQGPVSAWSAYCLGTLPFILGLLYFVTDMSRGAFAAERLPGAALGLSLLFIWMKCWQAVFADRLMTHLSQAPSGPWTLGRVYRLVVVQGFIQPMGLFALPFAAAILLPLGWTYAFFSHVTAMGTGMDRTVRETVGRAWRQTVLWPGQNHRMLLSYKLLFLFVFLNMAVTVGFAPFLLKMFFGIESVFTQNPWAMLNTTLFMGILALSYLCLDPFIKATYVLRTFYGESLQSGMDLRSELQLHQGSRRAAAVLWIAGLSLALVAPGTLDAAEDAAARPGIGEQAIAPDALDKTIDEVIQKREYAWRSPRDQRTADSTEKSFLERTLKSIADTVGGALKSVGRWIRDLINGFNFRGTPRTASGPGYDWFSVIKFLMIVLLVVVFGLVLAFLYRAFMSTRRLNVTDDPDPVFLVPDVSDDNVSADQLPQDRWLQLGQELLAKGDLRLALRAFYLASLASLADRNLITLARFKSNFDYRQELNRRAHALPGLAPLFRENVAVFDRVWYGRHEIDGEGINQFQANVHRLRE